MERGGKKHEVIKYTIHEKKRTICNLLTLFYRGNINVIIQDLDNIFADRKKWREVVKNMKL